MDRPPPSMADNMLDRELSSPIATNQYQQQQRPDKNDTDFGNGRSATNEIPSRTGTVAASSPCQYEKRERVVITKNVIVIGLAFMIHFTAFHGTSNLQSSLNSDKALGTTTLAVIYGSLILSNIFLPMSVIR